MVKIEWKRNTEAVITVTSRAWFGFGKEQAKSYRGSGTVWHDAVTGKRQPTNIESWLCDVWQKARWDLEGLK